MLPWWQHGHTRYTGRQWSSSLLQSSEKSGFWVSNSLWASSKRVGRGVPGPLSQLSVNSWFRLRSWSHSLWVQALHQALRWQLGACLGFSLSAPSPLSLSLSKQINLKKKKKRRRVGRMWWALGFPGAPFQLSWHPEKLVVIWPSALRSDLLLIATSC